MDGYRLFGEVRLAKTRKKSHIDQSWFSWRIFLTLKFVETATHQCTSNLWLHWWQFPNKVVQEADEERLSREPLIYKWGRISCGLKSGGSLCCSDRGKVEVMILRGGSSTKSRARTLNFGNANFNLVLVLCGTVFRDRKVKWLLYMSNRANFSNMWVKYPCRHQGYKKRGGGGGPCARADIPLQPAMKTIVKQLFPYRNPCWSSSWRSVDCRKGRTHFWSESHIGENQCSCLLGVFFFTPLSKKESNFLKSISFKAFICISCRIIF